MVVRLELRVGGGGCGKMGARRRVLQGLEVWPWVVAGPVVGGGDGRGTRPQGPYRSHGDEGLC